MRALTRMRPLAAACALLLFVAGMAAAGPLDRQIDRSGGAPMPPTTEAGEPDMGHNLTIDVVGQLWCAAWFSNPFLRAIPFPMWGLSIHTAKGSVTRVVRR